MQKAFLMFGKNNKGVLFFILLIAGILCLGIISVYSVSNVYNPNVYPKNGLSDFEPENIGYYKINPETILASLNRGESNIFAPEIATLSAPMRNITFSWYQLDYLLITNALFQSVWKESFNSWSLLSMVFETTCQDNPDGFESGDIHFFKESGEKNYTTREIIITPQYENVSWGGEREFPRPNSAWKSIDLGQLKISAEDALRIAEDNGGRSFRLDAKNKCNIGMILNMDAYDGWKVDYQGYDGLSNFVIQIDPYTGKVISSKKSILEGGSN